MFLDEVKNPDLSILNSIRMAEIYPSYKLITTPTGKCGHTELAMHCKVAGKKAKRVWVNERHLYAFVEFEDLSMCDGTWNLFSNGDFCIA